MIEFAIPLHRRLGPWPVSYNHAHRRGSDGQPKLTPKARAWRECVKECTMAAVWTAEKPTVRALLDAPRWRLRLVFRLAGPPRRQDDDNLTKLTRDGAIVEAFGVDDSRVAETTSRIDWLPPGEPSSLTVTIAPDG